jgi:FMN phosphatase YigB (HAD superfamily)
MAGERLTFFLDVDNTLVDNDAAKAELKRRLEALLGREAARFWVTYEAVRADTGVVNIPLTLRRFEQAWPAGAASRSLAERVALAEVFTLFPYPRFLFPDALAAIASLKARGRVTILSDGDPAFQVRKIWRAGLAAAVDGAVMVFDQKTKRLLEATAFYPADHYVIVDDKPGVLAAARSQLGAAVTTVHIAHGHYATGVDAAGEATIDIQIGTIGELPRQVAALHRS